MTASELLHSVTEIGVSLTDNEVAGKLEKLSDHQIDEMMRIADLDGDGKMKFSEFSKLMEHLLPVMKEKSQREVRKVMTVTLVMTVRMVMVRMTMTMVLRMTVTMMKVKAAASVLPSPTASGVRDLWSRVRFFIVTVQTTLAPTISFDTMPRKTTF